MSNNIKDLNDSSFDAEVLKSELPVLVDFWAPWCGPCKSIAPVLEELAETYKGQLIITKMNVDENPHTPTQYNVRGIPNLVFIKNGAVVNQIVGAALKENLIEAIENVIA